MIPMVLAVLPTEITDAITEADGLLDSVVTYGTKAAVIAGGLSLLFVVVAYIRKAKR